MTGLEIIGVLLVLLVLSRAAWPHRIFHWTPRLDCRRCQAAVDREFHRRRVERQFRRDAETTLRGGRR